MKLLIIEGSTRSPASTMAHAKALAAAQNDVSSCEILALKDLQLPLFSDHRVDGTWPASTVLDDLYTKMLAADIIVLATPLYWYSVSNLMKNFLDHWSAWLRHPELPMGEKFKDTGFVFLVVGGGPSDDPAAMPVFQSLKMSVNYIEGRCLGGVYGVGLREGSPDESSLKKIEAVDLQEWNSAAEERYI